MTLIEREYYTPSNDVIWQGRKTTMSNEYWYQCIQRVDLIQDVMDAELEYAIIGYACEEGVRRNQGRVGAKDGPEHIRRQLAKTAWHHSSSIGDLGDVVCSHDAMEVAQDQLSRLVTHAIDHSIFPIILGGGHDIAYGTFCGLVDAAIAKDKRIGILNFDAHFDLRPVDEQGNSGTPFNQILAEYGDHVSYHVLGIQAAANTKTLFDIAQANNVRFEMASDCTMHNFEFIQKSLDVFIEQVDLIYITIDMDGFSSAYAPGVSAPSPMGMDPKFVEQCLHHLKSSGKVRALDIAELNPKYDIDQSTAKLAARLVDGWISEK